MTQNNQNVVENVGKDLGLEVLDVNKVVNLDEVLSKYKLTRENITSSYSLQENNGIINLSDLTKKQAITFYVHDKKVEFQSTQQELGNGNVKFDLYDAKLNLVFSEEITPEGQLVATSLSDEITALAKPNKAALKWACIFSSYLACLTVAVAAGAAGALVSGPFGAAAGFAGGAACRYVFQTLVEKYGSKDQACKILS